MNSAEVTDMFCMACQRCRGNRRFNESSYFLPSCLIKIKYIVELPEMQSERNEKLKNFIICINQEIKDLGLEIKKAIDEESRYNCFEINPLGLLLNSNFFCRVKSTFFVLCNKSERSCSGMQAGKAAQLDFSVHELELLRIILDSIVEVCCTLFGLSTNFFIKIILSFRIVSERFLKLLPCTSQLRSKRTKCLNR